MNNVTDPASDFTSSAEACPSAGEEADDHGRTPPTRQGGIVPLLRQAVRCSGLSPESSHQCPVDGRQEPGQHPQTPEE